jgi:hypothetical protein
MLDWRKEVQREVDQFGVLTVLDNSTQKLRIEVYEPEQIEHSAWGAGPSPQQSYSKAKPFDCTGRHN